MNPKVLLTKLHATSTSVSPLQTNQGQSHLEQQQILNSKKVFSTLLNSSNNRSCRRRQQRKNSTCFMCNCAILEPPPAPEPAAEASSNTALLFNTFCKLFNATITDQDSFNLCLNCTEDLELLSSTDNELQIVKGHFERRRNQLMRIMAGNYVEKTVAQRSRSTTTRSGWNRIERMIDELTQNWKLNLNHEILQKDLEFAYQQLKQQKQQCENISNLVIDEEADINFTADNNNSTDSVVVDATVQVQNEPTSWLLSQNDDDSWVYYDDNWIDLNGSIKEEIVMVEIDSEMPNVVEGEDSSASSNLTNDTFPSCQEEEDAVAAASSKSPQVEIISSADVNNCVYKGGRPKKRPFGRNVQKQAHDIWRNNYYAKVLSETSNQEDCNYSSHSFWRNKVERTSRCKRRARILAHRLLRIHRVSQQNE